MIPMKRRKMLLHMAALLLCLALLPVSPALAMTQPEDTQAEALRELGIFKGNGDGFALGDRPTRIEAAVVLLRLMGKEQEALEENLPNPFADVPDWADAQIGYLYQNGVVKGLSESAFGNEPVDFNQAMTMILRLLGYDDGAGDFLWSSAALQAKELGVFTPRSFEEIAASETFTRQSLVSCVFSALQATLKGGGTTLMKKLLDDSVLTGEQIKNTGVADLAAAAGLVTRSPKRYIQRQDFILTPVREKASFLITLNLPDSYLNRQKVIGYDFSIAPTSIHSENGNLYATFLIDNLTMKTTLTVTTELELYEYDYEAAWKCSFPTELSEEERKEYTSPTGLLESGDPVFTGAELEENDGTEYGMVGAILAFTERHLSKQVANDDGTALDALKRGYGDCYDYALVFTALCRAKGIPARVAVGEVVPLGIGHAIVEVYFGGLGWVPIDPVNTGTESITLSHLEPDFVYLTDDLHSDVLFGGNFVNVASYGGTIEFKEKFTKK